MVYCLKCQLHLIIGSVPITNETAACLVQPNTGNLVIADRNFNGQKDLNRVRGSKTLQLTFESSLEIKIMHVDIIHCWPGRRDNNVALRLRKLNKRLPSSLWDYRSGYCNSPWDCGSGMDKDRCLESWC